MIDKEDGNGDLLHASGLSDGGMGEHVEINFRTCFSSIDCMTLVPSLMECIENDKAV